MRTPLRPIKKIVRESLKASDEKVTRMSSGYGRPGIVPERLINGLLFQILFTMGSERALMENIRLNLLYRWIVGIYLQDPV